MVRRVEPNVVLRHGRLRHLPGGMMAVLAGRPLVLRNGNSVAGMVTVLAGVADGLPGVFKKGAVGGQSALRTAFTQQSGGQPACGP